MFNGVLKNSQTDRYLTGGKKMAWSVGDKKNGTKKSDASKLMDLRPSDEEKQSNAGFAKGGKDLGSGMEMLELDFLLGVVESTNSSDKNDVTMRKLNFNELIRREQLNEIDSTALKVYAKDEDNFYGKNIQCAAMKELTIRTEKKS